MKILLVEPAYQNKYPPLGLMKISTFHKMRGDAVTFVKGKNPTYHAQKWDRIYITTLFSFYWKQTIETIKYYSNSVKKKDSIFIGGPMATIMADEIEAELGIKVSRGLLNVAGKLGLKNDHTIDNLIPDYSILDQIEYKYPVNDAYFLYATRGCVNKCPFCAVPTIEPEFVGYIPIKTRIEGIKSLYNEKTNLMLLDNNVLASKQFDTIIDEIKEAGFYKGAKFGKKLRYIDFNQGIDARLLTKEKMARLAEVAIRPLRIAFDNVKFKDIYSQKVRWASEAGITHLSNYILFNFEDTPEDLYERLKINIDLNEECGAKIFSFPMKYVPIKNRDRKFVGAHWTPKYLRGLQCILNATHGVVGPKRHFFETAFGKNYAEFKQILLMPENYILERSRYTDKARNWSEMLSKLSPEAKTNALDIISNQSWKKISDKEIAPGVKKLINLY